MGVLDGIGRDERRGTEGYEEIAEALIRGRQADVRGRKNKGGLGGLGEMKKIKKNKKQRCIADNPESHKRV